jgi:hypothetical protein
MGGLSLCQSCQRPESQADPDGEPCVCQVCGTLIRPPARSAIEAQVARGLVLQLPERVLEIDPDRKPVRVVAG